MVRGQWASLARIPGLHPYSFFEGHPGIFNDHREPGPRFNASFEGRIVPIFIYGIKSLYL